MLATTTSRWRVSCADSSRDHAVRLSRTVQEAKRALRWSDERWRRLLVLDLRYALEELGVLRQT